MARINTRGVLLGGLLAGLIINIGEFILNGALLADEFAAAMQALGVTMPEGGATMAVWIIMGFALGILAVWVHAAIRPRFGPGPSTAIIAGLTVFVLAYAYPTVGMLNLGLFPASLSYIGLVWGFFEIPLATLAGAALYKETGETSPKPASAMAA
ncbi:MAG: hypothetical protein ACRELD_14985 [Longimicrobiales bacterium]